MFLSIEKEEAWLEEMSAQGWHLVKVPGLCYNFEQGEPEQRVYKIDFRYFKRQDNLEEYTSLFEDSGWQAVDPKRFRNNFYFYTENDGSEKDIFSDEISKAQRSLRFANFTLYTFFITCLPYIVLYMNGFLSPEDVGYLTPGLWEMKGFDFVWHFLFETPFVIMRVTGAYFPLVALLIAAFFLSRSYILYQKKVRRTQF
jgi:hypothetical protein